MLSHTYVTCVQRHDSTYRIQVKLQSVHPEPFMGSPPSRSGPAPLPHARGTTAKAPRSAPRTFLPPRFADLAPLLIPLPFTHPSAQGLPSSSQCRPLCGSFPSRGGTVIPSSGFPRSLLQTPFLQFSTNTISFLLLQGPVFPARM